MELTPAVPENPGNSAFLLTLDYHLVQTEGIDPDTVLDWVDNAHGMIETLFEGCISDSIRALFGQAGHRV